MSIKTVGELINELQKFDENQEVELFSVTRNFADIPQEFLGTGIESQYAHCRQL